MLKHRETGGTLIIEHDIVTFNKVENVSERYNQFSAYFDKEDFSNKNFIGLWHTHPFLSFPSPQDFYQSIKLNLLFKRNFLMIILARSMYIVVKFKFLVIPIFKIKKYKKYGGLNSQLTFPKRIPFNYIY